MANFFYDFHEGIRNWLPENGRIPLVILPNLLRARAYPYKVPDSKLFDIISGIFGNLSDFGGQRIRAFFEIRQIVQIVEAAEEDYPILKLAGVTPSLLIDQLLNLA